MERQELRNDDDIEAILKIAVSRSGLSEGQALRDRLLATASELGLTPEQVEQAEEEWALKQREQTELAEFKNHQRKSFFGHLASYVVVNAFLVAVNVLTEGRIDWAWWPILGWGIGIAFGVIGTFFPKSESFQEDFEKWRKKKHRDDA